MAQMELEPNQRTRGWSEWKDHFAILLWWLWRWRNESIFNKREPTLEAKVAMGCHYSREVNSLLSYQSLMEKKRERIYNSMDLVVSTTPRVDDFKLGFENRLEGACTESDTGYGTITNLVLNQPNSDDLAEIPS